MAQESAPPAQWMLNGKDRSHEGQEVSRRDLFVGVSFVNLRALRA
jgi:hypothetical protein